MYCPRCGQERISTETSFCSKCGFLLAGTLELLMTGGVNPNLPAVSPAKVQSPRSRGIKQGFFIFLLTFLIVPIIAIITVAMNAEPYVLVIASILFAIGGLLRMAYAWMFESETPVGDATSMGAVGQQFFPDVKNGITALPSPRSEPIQSYMSPGVGRWQDTNELEPTSVTEGTTRLLEKDELDQ
jgi:hypothetical protein